MTPYDDVHKRCPQTDQVCLCPAACNSLSRCAAVPAAIDRVCCGEPFCCQTPNEPCKPRMSAWDAEPDRTPHLVIAEPGHYKAMQARSAARKASPVFSGVLNYFPDALMAVARVSKAGNDKHNPGQPLHWSREKSNDHMDCAARHLLTPYDIDPDSKEIHLANAAWRLLAELQLYMETTLAH